MLDATLSLWEQWLKPSSPAHYRWIADTGTSTDYCFKSKQLLIELDSATEELLSLVSTSQDDGKLWIAATLRHKKAYDACLAFLIPPEPVLAANRD